MKLAAWQVISPLAMSNMSKTEGLEKGGRCERGDGRRMGGEGDWWWWWWWW